MGHNKPKIVVFSVKYFHVNFFLNTWQGHPDYLLDRFSNYMKKTQRNGQYLQEESICSSLGHHLGIVRRKKVVGPAKGEETFKALCHFSNVSRSINLSSIQIQTLTDKDYFYNGCGLQQ